MTKFIWTIYAFIHLVFLSLEILPCSSYCALHTDLLWKFRHVLALVFLVLISYEKSVIFQFLFFLFWCLKTVWERSSRSQQNVRVSTWKLKYQSENLHIKGGKMFFFPCYFVRKRKEEKSCSLWRTKRISEKIWKYRLKNPLENISEQTLRLVKHFFQM